MYVKVWFGKKRGGGAKGNKNERISVCGADCLGVKPGDNRVGIATSVKELAHFY